MPNNTTRGRPRRATPNLNTPSEIRAKRAARRAERGTATLENLDRLPGTARLGVDAILVALQISTTTFWRRIKDGLLPALQADGGKRFWTAAQLRAVLDGSAK
jgi:hypothetical protein